MSTINNHFVLSDLETLKDNVFKIIDKDWMLITAGNPDHFNMMTASWGTLGILWHKPIAICFIRPQRYTFRFTEKSSYYTLSFFEEKHRGILQACGSKSGKNTDKIKETGLVPLATGLGNIGYEQARMILECKKLYADNLKEENFIIPDIAVQHYKNKDFHRFYIGEVVNCFIKE